MMRGLSVGIITRLKANGLAGQLVRGVGGGVLVSGTSALLALITTSLLARTLGPDGFGNYTFAFSLAMLLAIPTQAGLPILVLREVARYHAQEKWGYMNGLLRAANRLAAFLSVTIAGGALIVVSMLEATREDLMLYVFAFALIPLLALGNVRGATLQGLRHVVLGQIPENLFRPVVLLVCIAGVLFGGGQLTPKSTMAWHALASCLAVVIGALLLTLKIPKQVRNATPSYDFPGWFNSIAPLSLLAGVQVLTFQAGTILLGLFAEDEEVGIYRASLQVATIVIFALTVVSNAVAPYIARLHVAEDTVRLQIMVRNATRVILVVALPAVLICMLAGENILAFLFGGEFGPGYKALLILCVGQLVCAALGPTAYLMNMAGEERETLRGVILGAIINIGFGLILAPTYGMEGVATATTCSMVFMNIYLAMRVSAKLGIKCGPF